VAFQWTGGFAYGPAKSNTAISAVQLPNGIAGVADTFTPGSGTGSKTLAGWTVGGGGEWAFASHWSVKAEYLYYDLGTLSYSIPDKTIIAVTRSLPFAKVVTTASARFNGSIARAGFNYHFAGL
jgi:outer membrane immunogenic protein